MPIALKSGKPVLKATEIATTCACCSGTDCQCVACRNGCSFYVSGEGYDTYDARCEAPSAPSGGYMDWLAPTAQSSPGLLAYYYNYAGPTYEDDWTHLGKASLTVKAPFMPQSTAVVPPYVWGHKYAYQGTNASTYYQWYAGFSLSCVDYPNTSIRSLVLDAYLWDHVATGLNTSTERKAGVVLKTASGSGCKDVSVNSESRYNECPSLDVLGNPFDLCRIEVPFPLSVQINEDGTTVNGTLYAWNSPITTATPASLSFVVSKRDCCFSCESGSQNICCNPLP